MKIILASSAFLAVTAPSAIWADGLSFGGNLAFISNYISDGVSQSDGRPAFQPFFELSKNGVYANIWASRIKDEDGNSAALDLSTGYRADLPAGLSYDLGYTQHLFNKTHSYDAEIDGALDYAITEQLTLSGELNYDLAAHRLGEAFSAAYDLGNRWSVNGSLSKADPKAALVVGAGVGYALNDKLALDVQVQDPASSKAIAALSLHYAFGQGEN